MAGVKHGHDEETFRRRMAPRGEAAPLGVSLRADGVNVAVVSQNADAVFVSPVRTRRRNDRARNFPGAPAMSITVSSRASGPASATACGQQGHGSLRAATGSIRRSCCSIRTPRRSTAPCAWHPDLAVFGAETAHLVPKCIVTAPEPDAAPLPAKSPGFLYEIAVKAFTRLHPAVPEPERGTVAALGHPAVLEHLTRLGVDTVELMPLAAFIDERHLPALKLANAWGYNPVSFFAPDPRLAPGGLAEIRAAVGALHGAGIRVVLDVVFNHSGESDLEGATLSLRGLDNALYYLHEGGVPVNHAGTGNTLALDRPAVVAMVLDALRHWASATGIDGFRHDLATVMGQDGARLRPGSAADRGDRTRSACSAP